MSAPLDLRQKLITLFGANFLTDKVEDLAHYGRDWTTRITPNPRLICFPSSTEQVVELLKICSAENIAVVPSGGRTGLAAGAVAAHGEVVLSLVRMNQLISFRADEARVRVQAGMVHQALQDQVAAENLMWPVDLASKGSSQIGGNIATNAGGLRVLRYGHCRNWVQSLQVVLMNGDVLELSGELEKNNTGYDLRQLFIGGEGTLGVITEATLKLAPRPQDSTVFLFAGEDFSRIQRMLGLARQQGLSLLAAEFFSQTCLQTVLAMQGLKPPFAESAPYYGLLEIEVTGEPDRERISALVEKAVAEGLVLNGTLAEDESGKRQLWRYRETITESLSQLGSVYKNDLSLPLNKLGGYLDFLNSLQEIREASVEVYLFGHFGDGNVHVNLLNRAAKTAAERESFFVWCEKLNHTLFAELKKLGGSIAAEHGVGLLKKDYLSYTRPAAEIELMKRIKRVFDPQGLLNPGKIFDL